MSIERQVSFKKLYLMIVMALALLISLVPNIVVAQELPSMRFERSDPLALDWGVNEGLLQNSRTGGSATSLGLGRSNDVKELARALRYDPQKMFEYVHDNVEIHGTFGLSKGATGTAIDLNGNVLDQVHLLGELFLEAADNGEDITVVRYRYGVLTLTPAELEAWYGISNARAACEFLGAGGFPAKVQNTTDCSTLTGILTQNVEVGHFWLTAQIDGATKIYDPAFKRHTQYTPLLNLQSDMGYVGGSVSSSVGGSNDNSLAPSVINLNYNGLKNIYDARAQQLYGNIENNHYDASLNELIGGREIIPFDRDEIADGDTSFLGSKYDYKDVWVNIPHYIRATLRVHLYKPGRGTQAGQDITVIDYTFFADEIAGRRLAIEPNGFEPITVAGSGLIPDCGFFRDNPQYLFALNLTIDDENVPGTSISDACMPNERALFKIKLVSDSPYANQSGEYADREMDAKIDLVSRAIIVANWGKSGSATMGRYLFGLPSEDDAVPAAIEDFEFGEMGPPLNFGMTKLTENIRYRLAASWYSQFGTLSNLNDLASNSYSQNHSTIGLVFARTVVGTTEPGSSGMVAFDLSGAEFTYTNTEVIHNWNVDNESITLSLSNSTSITHLNADVSKRNAAAKTLASMSATLEGSVFEQMMDSADVGSTATKFSWANNGSEGGNASEDNAGGSNSAFQGAFKFYGFLSGASSQAGNLDLWTSGGRSSAECSATSGLAPECYWSVHSPTDLGSYLDSGYSVIAPSDVYLGPGMHGGTRQPYTTALGHPGWIYDPSYTRGGAFIAMKIDADGYLSDAAHVVSMPFRSAKGSGVSSHPEEIAMVNAPSGADLLKEQNELSWSHNVDLKSGGLTYAPGAILTSGVGGFPYSLSYEPTFASGETGATAPIWKHNWEFKADVSGSGPEAMGASRPINAVPTLVTLVMLNDIYSGTSTNMNTQIRMETGGAFINHIWSDHLTYNVVTITQGSSTEQFVRKPWTAAQNTFTAPSQSNATLVQTGSRTIGPPRTGVGDNGNDVDHPTTRAWRYDNLGFTLTDASQNLMTFSFWSKYYPDTFAEGLKEPGIKYGFRPTTWTLKTGVDIDFEYQELDSNNCVAGINNLALPGCRPVLTKVSNSLGRSLTFSYAYDPNVSVFNNGRDVTSVSDETGRTASVLTGADGQITQYTFRREKTNVIIDGVSGQTSSIIRARYLDAVYSQNDLSGANGAGASSKFSYDSLGRVKEFEYPTALSNGLKTYSKIKYHLADGRRSEVLNAKNHASVTIYDEHGRTRSSIDALGRRTDNSYDGLGRLTDTRRRNKAHAYNYYQLRNSYSYDEHHNKIIENTHPKTTASGSDVTTSTLLTATSFYENLTYPNLVTKTISPRGNASANPDDFAVTYEYDAKGQLTAQNGAEGERSETSYNSIGLPTSSKSLVSGTIGVDAVWRESTTSYCGLSDTINCPGAGYNLPISKTLLDPSGAAGNITTSFKWDAFGNLAEVTDPLGIKTVASYDAARRPVLIIKDPASASERQTFAYEYDAIGRPKTLKTSLKETGGSVSDWLVTRVIYDVNGRAGSVIDPDGDVTQFKYDERRWLDEQVDGAGRRTKYDYLSTGENYCIRRGYGTALQTTYKRNYFDYNAQPYVWSPGKSDPDSDCNVAEHQDNDPALDLYKRFRTLIAKDTYYRSARMTFPDKTFGLSWFDEDGNVTKTRNRRYADETIQEIESVYDKSGRVVTKTTPEAIYAYTYNKGGETLSTTLTGSGGGSVLSSITNTYDFAGRVTSECRLDGKCTSYGYDKRGQRTSLTWPDGWAVTYTYARSGALRQAVDNSGAVIAKYFYNRAGRVTSYYRGGASMALGAVSVTTHKFENDGDLARQTHIFTASDNVDMRYGYDGSSKLVAHYSSRDEYMWSGASVGAPATKTTSYQTAGNGYTGEDMSAAANDLDQYGSVDGENLLYDGRGNMVAYGAVLYLHNSENQLKSASGTNASGNYTQSYVYGPLGRRIFTQTDTAGTITSAGFVHAGDMEIAELDNTGNIIRRYVPGTGVDNRIVMINVDPAGGGMGSEQSRFYYVTDRLGNVIAMVDELGAVTDRYVYSPYGVEDQLTGSGNPFRYTGRKFDAATGIYYYRARYYHQGLGRFLETDPVGYSDQMNLYGYVGNDPLNATDPTGMCKGTRIGSSKDSICGDSGGGGGGSSGAPAPDSGPPDNHFRRAIYGIIPPPHPASHGDDSDTIEDEIIVVGQRISRPQQTPIPPSLSFLFLPPNFGGNSLHACAQARQACTFRAEQVHDLGGLTSTNRSHTFFQACFKSEIACMEFSAIVQASGGSRGGAFDFSGRVGKVHMRFGYKDLFIPNPTPFDPNSYRGQ